jgi:hypothetical protein
MATQERNKYLELDGLVFDNGTHEWFADKSSTSYAHNPNQNKISLPTYIVCYVVRNKETGEYDRVMVNHKKNQDIFNTKELELMGVEIDKMKLKIAFDKTEEK